MRKLAKRFLRQALNPVVNFRSGSDRTFLTFDDGPHPQRTPAVLDQLEKHGVKATFFMIGAEAEKYPEIARRVVSAGHTIGYHSHNHPHMRSLSVARQFEELRGVNQLSQLLGRRVSLYRPPYGELTIPQLGWCLIHGLRVVMWSIETGDSFAHSADEVAKRMKTTSVQHGDIVLLHDDTASAIESLPLILGNLQNAGLVLDRLPERRY